MFITQNIIIVLTSIVKKTLKNSWAFFALLTQKTNNQVHHS